MKQEVTQSMFRDEFRAHGRHEAWSYDGLGALYDYLEEVFNDDGEDSYELDVIALDCSYTEYNNFDEFNEDYGGYLKSLEELEQKTTVIFVDKITDYKGDRIQDRNGRIIVHEF
jgi:hypothetical protein